MCEISDIPPLPLAGGGGEGGKDITYVCHTLECGITITSFAGGQQQCGGPGVYHLQGRNLS